VAVLRKNCAEALGVTTNVAATIRKSEKRDLTNIVRTKKAAAL
jgi:hypothetical protein